MSYCRFGPDSDVYVYAFEEGEDAGWCCCGCPFGLGNSYAHSLEVLELHLQSHVKAGHKVPQRAFDRIKREMEEDNG